MVRQYFHSDDDCHSYFQPLPHITPHALMQDSHYRDYCESLTIVKSMDETGAGLTHRESYQQQVAPYLSTLNW